MKLLVSIFRSPKKEGMYLYVEKARELSDVPETLLGQFGKPELVMNLMLAPDRKLANADAGKVLDSIKQQGFYLQLPPQPVRSPG